MIKQSVLFCAIVLINLSAYCQTVGTYIYKNKTYSVYPFRIDDSEDILLVGYKIPDGEYIAFANYNFKEKSKFRKTPKHILTDTNIVKGIFTIKKNAAEGSAIFYSYDITGNGKQSHKPSEETKGSFVNGLKSGIWSEGDFGKPPTEFTTYQNGIKQGYHWRTNSIGGNYMKEKFCDGDECDTIFYYYNGKIMREYDLTSKYYSPQLTSCYNRGIGMMNVSTNKINTFYREYENGKLIIDLKYLDGEVLPFDSIGKQYLFKDKEWIKYVTIKNVDEHHKVLTYKDTYRQRFTKIFFEDDFLYQSIDTSYNSYTRRKNIFSKKKTRIDTTIDASYYVTPSKIIDTSIVPIIVQKSVRKYYNYKTYYIPKYKFLFDSSNDDALYFYSSDNHNYNATFNKIDTVNKIIYLNGQTDSFREGYTRKVELLYINDNQEKINRRNILPYFNKDYIVTNNLPNYFEDFVRYDKNMPDYKTDEFTMLVTKPTYYKKDSLLNGAYCISDAGKPKKWPTNIVHTEYTGLKEDISIGQFVAGKKEGLWTELNEKNYLKKTPLDIKNYFFTHPKKVEWYKETIYKNGMKDGAYTIHIKYNPKDDDSYSKDPIIIYKEIESHYTRDTLNGNYKQYHRNGKLMQELNLVMGSPDGEFKEYDLDGNLTSSIQFNKGRLDGIYKKYEGNALFCFANFKNNLLHDSLVYYYSNHVVSERVLAKNDTLIKKIKYYDSGKIKEEVNFDKYSTYTITEELMLSQSFVETINSGQYDEMETVQAWFKNYYDTGQLLSEGHIKNGQMNGVWRFYSINGIVIHEVDFQDTLISLPNSKDSTVISGFYKGYYTNGNKRCDGYINDLEVSYDCFTKQDKAALDFYVINFFDINGKQILKNGSGYFIKYEANGLRVSSGKLVNCVEDSLWKYYTPEQKLDAIGNYVNGEKDGVWYEGDLEGVNFEDGACFDMNNKDEVKAFDTKRKELSIKKIIYREGSIIDTQRFNSDLNKTYRPKHRGRNRSIDF